MVTSVHALLLLADGRFPAGGYAHSGGVEAAVLGGLVQDVAALAAYLEGRLATTGLVEASFAAAAAAPDADLARLDAEMVARMPSPALRAASRSQATQLLRAARSVWPDPSSIASGDGLLASNEVVAGTYPVALGLVARVAGIDPAGAALLACHHAISGPASAAVRLLGLDPLAVHRLLAELSPMIEAVAAEAADQAALATEPADLPALTALFPELAADAHAIHADALFAS